MTRSLLPPRGLFIGTRWVFDPKLAAPLKETLLQLMILSWGANNHCTPPLTIELLSDLTGKSARTLKGHLLELRAYHAALRFQRADARQFIIILADWLYRNSVPAGASASDPVFADVDDKSLHRPVKEEEEEDVKTLKDLNLLLLPDHDLDPDLDLAGRARGENSADVAKRAEGGRKYFPDRQIEEDEMAGFPWEADPQDLPAMPETNIRLPGRLAAQASAAASTGRVGGRLPVGDDIPQERPVHSTRRARSSRGERPGLAKDPEPLSAELEECLRAAEVFPALFGEIAARAERDGYSDADLLGLLDWCRQAEPDHPAALFIGRLRAGARAPEAFINPPCPRCGKRGGHERHCPHSYAVDY